MIVCVACYVLVKIVVRIILWCKHEGSRGTAKSLKKFEVITVFPYIVKYALLRTPEYEGSRGTAKSMKKFEVIILLPLKSLLSFTVKYTLHCCTVLLNTHLVFFL